MPSLESIETDFTHTKTLGLFLKEAGVKKPWTSEEISDGTIQAIALLAATFDTRIPLLVIEEPENSVHPWAIRNFVQAFREASKQKQIFLTTHSPVLLDQIRPEELWVVQRPELETKITPVLELDPSLKDAWGQGKFTLSEYLDSGALPEAVPAAGS
jgi:predicted ATPase